MLRLRRFSAVIPLTVVICVALSLQSCSKKEEAFTAAPFVANAALVGSPVNLPEIGLEIAMPAGWYAADTSQLDGFRRMLAGTELAREFFPVFPLAVIMDSLTGGLMYIAQIEENTKTVADIAERYTDFLSPRLEGSGMNRGYYTINNTRIYYYLLHSAEVVNYKVIGETSPGRRYLIEYIIGGPTFTDVEPSVSASLATLRATP